MVLYIEYPKYTTRKILELINKQRKVAWWRINTQKSLAFLYTNNKKKKREILKISGIRETISFIKRIKYLGINLHKETKDLYL